MNLEHIYTSTFPELATPAEPEVPSATTVLWVNEDLAAELGLDATWLASADGLRWLTGADGKTSTLAYSGHQFGHLSPILGDGRAHLLGEVTTSEKRVDIHLKGSGLTPFSRPGSDGKAPLSAVWREAVIGEALHALGVPTSRALAVLETGETVRRRSPLPEPAGILVRVADSHLRVGTFQYAHMNIGSDQRIELAGYALSRHYPQVNPGDNPALTLLRLVAEHQAHLVAQWMGLGFVHGVLNTDNVSISGHAIDFGPCAFIDGFSHDAVYSSIDRGGRYAYRNQPGITQWNLARFAESLLDLIDSADPNRAVHLATDVLAHFEEIYQDARTRIFAAKLGVTVEDAAGAPSERLVVFIDRTLDLLDEYTLDFTGFFRMLTDAPNQLVELLPTSEVMEDWLADLAALRQDTGTAPDCAEGLMQTANPVYIPRNLHLEAALRAAEGGDAVPILRLLDAVRQPFTRRPDLEDLETAPARSHFFTSFCGT